MQTFQPTTIFLLALAVLLTPSAHAFISQTQPRSSTQLHSLWRNWVPQTDFMELMVEKQPTQREFVVVVDQTDKASLDNTQHEEASPRTVSLVSETKTKPNPSAPNVLATTAALAAAFVLAVTPLAAVAVSGGGLDFAGLDISNQDFSKGNYKGKDFTQVLARNTNFAGSNLQGCRFPKAYLINANYEGADVRGVSFEGTNMENTNLKNAVASGAYFGATVIDAASVENADFTDAQFPPKTLALMCDRPDMKGTNPTTGVDTRDSAMCP